MSSPEIFSLETTDNKQSPFPPFLNTSGRLCQARHSRDMDYYDVCVVGAGMLGSAAARHLALMLRDSGKQLALIGPAEPRGSWADHDGYAPAA